MKQPLLEEFMLATKRPLRLHQFYDFCGAFGYLIVDNHEIKLALRGKLFSRCR
jgi:hypothetical protein